MATTYKQIGSTVTVGAGGSSTITFNSIPATYTDLVIMLSARTSTAYGDSVAVAIQANSTGDKARAVFGTGSSASAFETASNWQTYGGFFCHAPSASQTANTFSNVFGYIQNYAGDKQKAMSVDSVTENNATGSVYQVFSAGTFNTTAAITSLTITCTVGNFVQNSTASIYGVKNS
jgi:hypothetical protein